MTYYSLMRLEGTEPTRMCLFFVDFSAYVKYYMILYMISYDIIQLVGDKPNSYMDIETRALFTLVRFVPEAPN